MDTKDKVKELIDIVELIGGYVELKKAGRNYKGVCPFHSEKTPSFMVSPELQIYKCFGCNKSGDAFSFIQEVEGIDFNAALQQLSEKAGVKVEKVQTDPNKEKKQKLLEINNNAAKFYHHLLLNHPIGRDAKTYLKNRGLKPSTIKEYKLGFAPNTWSMLADNFIKKYQSQLLIDAGLISPKRSGTDYFDRFRGRVMFPLVGIAGEVVGFNGRAIYDDDPKYLNTNETLIFNKGSFIYGLDKAKIEIKHEGAIFVEGPMDVISAHQSGIKNVIASSGTALTQTQLKILKRYTADICFCFDTDVAGINAIYRAVELAENESFNITVLVLPEKYKDLDEFVKADLEKARTYVKDAKLPIYDFYIQSTLAKYDAKSSIGKKKIMSDLTPLFNKIKSPVTLDHYTKRIAEELDLDEETVKSLIRGNVRSGIFESMPNSEAMSNSTTIMLSKKSPQEYILALLLRVELDIAQTILYKLGQKDFTNPVLQAVFIALKNHLIGRQRRFNIEILIKRIDKEFRPLVNEMYLWDLGRIGDDLTLLNKELESVYTRVKTETVRREMQELSNKIKEAEKSKDIESLSEYTSKLKDLSAKLIQ